MMKFYSIALMLLLAFAACEDDTPTNGNGGAEQVKIDDDAINAYLNENNREAAAHTSGLYYEIIEEGTGENPDENSTVEVKYKGYLTNNVVFDQTANDDTFEYPLSRLITGWQIGIPLIQKGGKAILYIPSYLGYGTQGAGSIPPNSVLIFEIELIDFE